MLCNLWCVIQPQINGIAVFGPFSEILYSKLGSYQQTITLKTLWEQLHTQ